MSEDIKHNQSSSTLPKKTSTYLLHDSISFRHWMLGLQDHTPLSRIRNGTCMIPNVLSDIIARRILPTGSYDNWCLQKLWQVTWSPQTVKAEDKHFAPEATEKSSYSLSSCHMAVTAVDVCKAFLRVSLIVRTSLGASGSGAGVPLPHANGSRHQKTKSVAITALYSPQCHKNIYSL